jgi:hypothetical protein
MSRTTREPIVDSRGAKVRRGALLALPFQVVSVAVAIVLSFFEFDFAIEVWLTLILVPVFWLPLAVELVFRTTLPLPLHLSYLLFIAGGPVVGTALHVYWVLPWWDILVHLGSGIMLTWLGLVLVQHAEAAIGRALPLWFSVSVAAATSMAFAALWEISEFASDVLVGTQTQHGLDDSMTDVIAGTLGTLVALAILLISKRPRTLLPLALSARDAD